MKTKSQIEQHNGTIRKLGNWSIELEHNKIVVCADYSTQVLVIYDPYRWACDRPEALPGSVTNWINGNVSGLYALTLSGGEIMTHQETVKECRRLCRALGLTFKHQDAPQHTGAVYQIVSRRNGAVLMHSLSLSTAYNNLCSGYVERLVFL
jgi:hypothetical protein